ncbi:flagellar basal body rod protein FlgB [Pseudodesulfovibrio sp.]|uniref:flagellar basal body rod protein FlgB n=1 Tax=Pseudodesulfovibrio sp. TaxID=2035812 RepID=UPI0026112FDE|nr:flagellar basal body rod protein FlgB [Pseudodesulfovibrio sp.]MDD3312372.1 flagellar basal body rod protein FlgB [Pseudodesulfovibrio sp.]
MKGIFAHHIQLTEKVLDLRLQRQNLVMGNIANVNTPDFKARSLEFEDNLQKALDLDERGRMTRTSREHMPVVFDASSFKGEGIEAFQPRTVYGEDSVDLDKEMAVMTKNGLMYDALASVIKKNFDGIRQAIQEGGK